MIQNELIVGHNFDKICDFIIDQSNPYFDKRILDKNCTIFCKTDYIDSLFQILKLVPDNRKYIIISGRADRVITRDIYNLRPKCVISWFAVNNLVNEPDIISLPYGLENYYGCEKGSSMDIEAFLNEGNNIQPKQFRLFGNFNFNTNKLERLTCHHYVSKSKYFYTNANRISFKEFIHEINKSFFVVSPEGNAPDCHRTWETLYLRSIPIVKKSVIFKDCLDLPMVMIDSWDQVTDKFLEEQYIIMKDKQYNLEKLNLSYWFNLINNEKVKIGGM